VVAPGIGDATDQHDMDGGSKTTLVASTDAQPYIAKASDVQRNNHGAGIRPAGATLVVAPDAGNATAITASTGTPSQGFFAGIVVNESDMGHVGR